MAAEVLQQMKKDSKIHNMSKNYLRQSLQPKKKLNNFSDLEEPSMNFNKYSCIDIVKPGLFESNSNNNSILLEKTGFSFNEIIEESKPMSTENSK